MRRMLMPQSDPTGRCAVGIPGEQARDDGMDEQRVAAVDEEVELVAQNPNARTSSRNFWTLRSLMSS